MSFAYACAEDAHERFFSSRCGIWDYEREGLFVLYDNNPTRVATIRERTIALVHEAIADRKLELLGEAYYPLEGENARYSWALVVDAHGTSQSQLVSLWEAALQQSWAEADAKAFSCPPVQPRVQGHTP